jgi:hypothetical protein
MSVKMSNERVRRFATFQSIDITYLEVCLDLPKQAIRGADVSCKSKKIISILSNLATMLGMLAKEENAALRDSQVARFTRQYLQLEASLDFPDSTILREASTQRQLRPLVSRHVESSLAHLPPPRYRFRMLKELLHRIEESIEDWDDQVGHFRHWYCTLADCH